jgi:hypothetical protein
MLNSTLKRNSDTQILIKFCLIIELDQNFESINCRLITKKVSMHIFLWKFNTSVDLTH